jgi:GNAT superfamily N-acetyltransferase
MMDDVFIIKPTKEDRKSVYEVFEVSIRDAFEKEGLGDLKKDILAEIENKRNLFSYSLDNKDSDVCFLVAKLDEHVIGTISFGPCGSDIKKCTNYQLDTIGELGSLYVLPHYQGQGVGSALIHAMIKHLHELGIEQFCLDSGYKRAQRKWLRKFGEPYKIVKDYWGKDFDHMVWLCKVNDYVKN